MDEITSDLDFRAGVVRLRSLNAWAKKLRELSDLAKCDGGLNEGDRDNIVNHCDDALSEIATDIGLLGSALDTFENAGSVEEWQSLAMRYQGLPRTERDNPDGEVFMRGSLLSAAE